MSSPEQESNEAFQQVFKLIFGKECGRSMGEMRDYLLLWQPKPVAQTSFISGKQITMSSGRYAKGSKFIAQDEIRANSAKKPLNINEIKDIDSMLIAMRERAYYAGNKLFGRFENVNESDCCTDAFHVWSSHNVESSKYIAYSSYIREGSEYVFGSSFLLRGRYLIRSIASDLLTRCFESYISTNSSDAFFCYNVVGCDNVMFSFNLRSKRNCIGNLQLQKDRYNSLRKHLLEQAADYMEKNRRFYSIFDLPSPVQPLPKIAITNSAESSYEPKPMDDAFASTCKVVLGKPIGPLSGYAPYLTRHTTKAKEIPTAFGNRTFFHPLYYYPSIPKDRAACQAEEGELAKLSISLSDNEMPSLEELLNKIDSIAFFPMDFSSGDNMACHNTQIKYHAMHAVESFDSTYMKFGAYNTMALHAENMFGCYRAIHSKFCINCHDCVRVAASMELDACTNCSNCYFCHNCENLENCMFCFNAKGLRYAIGNTEVGKEAYDKAKKLVLGEIVRKIEANKGLDSDIYNIGSKNVI